MDRLRQGVFSSLGSRIEQTRVADLFAGTGSYGLEALSRGAVAATFIEKNPKACSMIKSNLQIVAKSMGVERLNGAVIAQDATKPLAENQRFDILFVDPPYELIPSLAPKLFAVFDQLLADDGIVVFEMPGQLEIEPLGWTRFKRLGKGKDQPTACFYERA